MPAPPSNSLANALLRGWSVDNVVQARSAPPVDVNYEYLGQLSNGFVTNPRPDVVAGQPFYLYGPIIRVAKPSTRAHSRLPHLTQSPATLWVKATCRGTPSEVSALPNGILPFTGTFPSVNR